MTDKTDVEIGSCEWGIFVQGLKFGGAVPGFPICFREGVALAFSHFESTGDLLFAAEFTFVGDAWVAGDFGFRFSGSFSAAVCFRGVFAFIPNAVDDAFAALDVGDYTTIDPFRSDVFKEMFVDAPGGALASA